MRERYKNLFGKYYSASEAAANVSLEDLVEWAYQATRARDFDLEDYDDMNATTPRIYSYTPSSSSDLIGTEKAGDIAVDTSYIYVVVDNSGTLQWQRVATATF